MAKTLDKSTITSLGIVKPGHVSQSVDAFTGVDAYDITLSGSLTTTGSVTLSGSLTTTGSVDVKGNIESTLFITGERLKANAVVITNLITEDTIGSGVKFDVNVTASGNISSSLQLLGKSLEIEETASIGRSLTVGTTLVVAETITGDGEGITNLQRPISNSVSTNFSASALNSGFYFRVGGNVTCSIGTSSIYNVPIGVEYEFFQTSSDSNFSFVTGSSTIILNSKGGRTKLSGQFSAATLKKVGGDEWDLIGDLG